MKEPNREIFTKWHKDPDNWKCGVFYYNPEDPRGMVPKRIKWMGWTLNFANTKAVILYTVLFIFIIALLNFYG